MSSHINDALSNLHIKSLIYKFKGDDQKIKELQRKNEILKDYANDLINSSYDYLGYGNLNDLSCANKHVPAECQWLIFPEDSYFLGKCFLCTKIICHTCIEKYKCQECGFLICINCGFDKNEHKRYLKWKGKPKCSICSKKKKNSRLII